MVCTPAVAEFYVCACWLLATLSTRGEGASLGFLSTGKSDIGADLLTSLFGAGDSGDVVPAKPLPSPAQAHIPAKTPGYRELRITALTKQQAVVNRKQASARQGLKAAQLQPAQLSLPVSPEKVLDLLKGIRLDKIKAKPKPLPVSAKKTVPVPSSQSVEPPFDPPRGKDQRNPAAFNKASHLDVLPAPGFVPRRIKSGNGIKASVSLGPDPAAPADPPSAEQSRDLAPKAPQIPAHSGSRGAVGIAAAAAVAHGGETPADDVVLLAGSEDPAVAAVAAAAEQRMPCIMFPTNPPPQDNPQESSHLHVPHSGDAVPIPDEDKDADVDDPSSGSGSDGVGDGDAVQEGRVHNWASQQSHSSSQSRDSDQDSASSSLSASSS